MIKVFLIIAVIIQTVATVYALRLVRATKYNAVWILFIIGFAALGRTYRAGHGGQRRRGYPARHLLVAGRGDLDLHVDRRDVRPQADPLHRPPQPPATIDAESASSRPCCVPEEKSRSQFSKELHDGLGPLLSSAKIAHGAVARRAHRRPSARSSTTRRHRRGDPLRCAKFRTTFRRRCSTISDWRAASRTSSRAARRCSVRIRFTTNLRAERFDTDIEVILYRVVCETDKQLAQTTRVAARSTCRLVGRRHADCSTTRTTAAASTPRR